MIGHGTLRAYRNCCRCPYCRRAYRIAAEQGEVRLRSADRVREHLKKLVATGWSKREIAEALGKHPSWITKLAHARQVQQGTEEAMLALPLCSPRLARMLQALGEGA